MSESTIRIDWLDIGFRANFIPLPVRITAEISCSHMGDFNKAIALIDSAKTAGADLVKFQAFTLDEVLTLRGDGQAPKPWDRYTKRDLYTMALTPLDWLPALFQHARAIGLVPFSAVSGYDSLAALQRCACPAYKIARPDANRRWLIEAAGSTGKPVIASTEGTEPGRYAWNVPVSWLYCEPGYPSPARYRGNHAHLGASIHNLDPEIAVVAVARGARILEYHLMLPDTEPLDAAFSHTPDSFAAMVKAVRHAEAILGAS